MTTAWKKSQFSYATNEGEKTVTGYVSGPFGIDKREGFRYWTVTHLPSGMRLSRFETLTLKETKQELHAVRALNWQGKDIHEIAANNGMTAREFTDQVNRLQYGPVREYA